MVPRCPLLSRAGGSEGTKTLKRSCLLVMKSTILPRPLLRQGAEGTELTFLTKLDGQARCSGRALPSFQKAGLKGLASPQFSTSPGQGF